MTNKKILLVGENLPISERLSVALNDLGFSYKTVHSAIKARRELSKNIYSGAIVLSSEVYFNKGWDLKHYLNSIPIMEYAQKKGIKSIVMTNGEPKEFLDKIGNYRDVKKNDLESIFKKGPRSLKIHPQWLEKSRELIISHFGNNS